MQRKNKVEIAEIVPKSCLSLIADRNYHMCLAQLVLKDKEYAEFYKDMANRGKYVILDNGACEGESLTYDQLYEAYKIIQPSEIILPDLLFDRQETLFRSMNFYSKYMKDEKVKIMAVPQGKNISEWIIAAEIMLKHLPLNTIGIPKWLGNQHSLNRVLASTYLADKDVEIHLLGCSEGPSIVKMCREMNEKVRGCDSAFAYICAKNKWDCIHEKSKRPEGHIDFLNDPKLDNLSKLMDDFEKIAEGEE